MATASANPIPADGCSASIAKDATVAMDHERRALREEPRADGRSFEASICSTTAPTSPGVTDDAAIGAAMGESTVAMTTTVAAVWTPCSPLVLLEREMDLAMAMEMGTEASAAVKVKEETPPPSIDGVASPVPAPACFGTVPSAAAPPAISSSVETEEGSGRCSVGAYSPRARRARIARFHAKREQRCWVKRKRKVARTDFWHHMVRVRGRFVRKCSPPPLPAVVVAPVVPIVAVKEEVVDEDAFFFMDDEQEEEKRGVVAVGMGKKAEAEEEEGSKAEAGVGLLLTHASLPSYNPAACAEEEPVGHEEDLFGSMMHMDEEEKGQEEEALEEESCPYTLYGETGGVVDESSPTLTIDDI